MEKELILININNNGVITKTKNGKEEKFERLCKLQKLIKKESNLKELCK